MYSLKPTEFIKYYQHVVFNSLVVEHRCRTTTGTRQPILATTLKPFLLPTVIGCQYGLSSGKNTLFCLQLMLECLDNRNVLILYSFCTRVTATVNVWVQCPFTSVLEIPCPTVFPSLLPSHWSLMERYGIDVLFRAGHSTPFFPAELSTRHQLFPEFWIVVTLFINLHPLHKETSLMRFESCTNLQMQWCVFRK